MEPLIDTVKFHYNVVLDMCFCHKGATLQSIRKMINSFAYNEAKTVYHNASKLGDWIYDVVGSVKPCCAFGVHF